MGHEIQILYNGEKLIVMGLEGMMKHASDPELKPAFQQHREDTEMHVIRLDQAAALMHIDTGGDKNPSIKGLLAEGEKVMHKDASPEVLDAKKRLMPD